MSNTTHVVTIKFVSTGANTITKPLTDVNKGTQTLTKSNMDLTKAQNQQVPILAKLKTGYTASGQAQNTLVAASNKYSATLPKQSQGQQEVANTSNQMTGAQNKAGTSMGGLTEKFTKFRPLIFGGTGIVTAGIEAVGMWAMYSSASEKVAAAQETVNMLIASGQQDTAEYTQATNDLTDAKRSQSFALRIMILSFSDLAPMILLSVNAVLNMRKALTEGKAAIDSTVTSATNLANIKKTSLIPAVSNFNLELGKTPKMQDAVSNGMNMMGKNTKSFLSPLKDLGSKFKQTFSGIHLDIGKTDGLWNKMKAGFSAMGSAIVSGLKGLGSGFKAAGSAVLAFGKTLLGVFMSNPVLLLITAISVAIGALIFDLGGFRTRLNELGVTLGKMAPWAKPFLDVLGGISKGFEGAGTWIKSVLGMGDATKKLGQDAAAAANQFDPLLLSLQKVLDVGENFERLNEVKAKLDNVSVAINNMSVETQKGSGIMKASVNTVANQFETFAATVTTTDSRVIAAEAAMRKAIEDVRLGVISKDQAQAHLDKTYAAYLATIQESRKEEESQIEMHNVATIGTKSLSAEVISLSAALKDNNVVQGELAKAREEDKNILEGWIRDMGMANNVSNLQLDNYIKNTAAIKAFGTEVVLTDDKLVDVEATILKIVQTNNQMGADATEIWGAFMQQVNEVGSKFLPVIPEVIKLIRAEDEALADALEEKFEAWKENNVEVAGQMYVINEAEVETAKKVDKSTDSLDKKAKKLKIYTDIQGLSLDQQEIAVQLEGNIQKEYDQTTETLQEMALARGMDHKAIFTTDAALRDHIKTHKLNAVSAEEVANATRMLAADREEEQRATELETKALQALAKEMNIAVDTTKMSAQGIQSLIQMHDDMSNALQIATDDVQLWWAELEKSQKIEEVTIQELLKFAETMEIDIPQAIIDKGIPAIKEYIEAQKGIGEGAKKAAEDAKKAFDDLANKANDAITNLIKDDVLKGKGKKVEKTLEEIGLAVDSLAAKRAIIEVGANTTDFTDKISGIDELVISELQGIPPKTTAEADRIITMFADSMESELGDRIPGIGDTILSVWDNVKATAKPSESAAQMVERFRNEIMKDPAKFEAAVNAGIIDPSTGALDKGFANMSGLTTEQANKLAEDLGSDPEAFTDAAGNLMGGAQKGFEAGGHVFATEGQKAKYKWLLAFEGKAAAEAYAAGKALPENAAKGVTQNATLVTDAAGNLVTSVGGEMMLIENEATTATEPVPGIFSQAFLDASNQAGTQLATMVTNVHTKMSSMSTSVATYSDSMKVNFTTAINAMGLPLPTLGEKITALQGIFSNFSTSVATYSTSIKTNWQTMANMIITDTIRIGSEGVLPLTESLVIFFDYITSKFVPELNTKFTEWADLTIAEFLRSGKEGLLPYATAFEILYTSQLEWTKKMNEDMVIFADSNINEFVTRSLKEGITPYHEAFQTLSTSVKTYSVSMAKNIEIFSSASIGSFETGISSGILKYQKASSTLSTTVATHSKSMAANLKSFSSSAVSSLNAVTSAANKATSALNKMAAAAKKAAQAKSSAGMRFGGTIINTGNFGQHAQMGRSWIVDKPTQIAGVNVGELRKAELITVTPLTNPNDPSDKSIDPMRAAALGLGNATKGAGVQNVRTLGGSGNKSMSGGGGGSSGMANIRVHADIQLTTTTPSGQVIKKELTNVIFDKVASITAR